jgi:transposase-like protein
LNNIIEQDHRFIKTRIAASLGFRSIRKGQIRWLSKGDVVGQRQFIHTLSASLRDPEFSNRRH